jgi:large subunit ribosomal protein L33
MPRDKIILACTVCQERNHPERQEWKKHCSRCNAHTAHKETK